MVDRLLVVHIPGEPPAEYEIGDVPLVAGREPSCDVCLPSKYVSRRHFRLDPGPYSCMLADLGGANAILVNGQKVEGSVQLRDEDRIRIADVTMEFRESSETPSGTIVFNMRQTEQQEVAGRDAILRITRNIWGQQHLGPGGTVSIMFTDIEDSTMLVATLGDAVAQHLIQMHNNILREQFKVHRGFEAKRVGDGFLVLFASARDALAAAIGIQRHMHMSMPQSAGAAVKVRIGIHVGEVLWDGDDIFGTAVNFAARVASQAKGEEIMVSSLLREIVSATGEFAWGEERYAELKGFEGQHRLYRVRWEQMPGPE